MIRLRYLLSVLRSALLTGLILLSTPLWADEESHDRHQGHDNSSHSDQLLVLLNHKIALQKLQQNFPSDTTQQSRNLAKQKRLLDKALPVLEAYLQIPAERYPNTSLYEQSLHNRSAMLQDYGHIVSEFYHKLLGG